MTDQNTATEAHEFKPLWVSESLGLSSDKCLICGEYHRADAPAEPRFEQIVSGVPWAQRVRATLRTSSKGGE